MLLWHGFLGTGYSWHKVMPLWAAGGYAVLVPDMRGYGDSDKPPGVDGYDGRALAEEFRSLVKQIGFGSGRPLTIVAHDMGAPPALLWASDHPDEVGGLIYAEAPAMLQSVLEKMISYTPQAMAHGSMWWWILPLAPGVPEALIVGKEREFLNWFFEGPAVAKAGAIAPSSVDEYLRTFSGKEGVLTKTKVKVPVIAMGGAKGLGQKVGEFVSMMASEVRRVVLRDCGHFIPEEDPQAILDHVRQLTHSRGEP